MANRIEVAFQVIRIVLVILLAIIFVISTIYFIKAIDAIGDDVEEARETHFGHEIEEDNDFVDTLFNTGNRKNRPKFDPYEDYDDYGGRLITGGHHHFRVTNSQYKQHHIVSLIVWVVLTLFCAILSLAGILGAIFLNACMVLFCAIMILVHAICSHVLPIFHIQFPQMTSNWFLLALEVPAITTAILFVLVFRARQKRIIRKFQQRRILY